jgi:hypothetical protein
MYKELAESSSTPVSFKYHPFMARPQEGKRGVTRLIHVCANHASREWKYRWRLDPLGKLSEAGL